ncbi:MAG TPA: DUF4390 domain-containing protein [Steroidobacteraceae bacterium]|jgi:hypothetical protein|nr:DUF4390 domain-containing protein [Steroidobacteraceae bacterium]
MPRRFSALERALGHLYRGRWPSLTALAAALLMALSAAPAQANALDGALQVSSAYVNFDHGVIQLYARIQYPLNPAIREALQDGVTLTFDVEARVDRVRHLWFDANVVDVTLRRELAYRVVTDRFVVRDVRSGDQKSFETLKEALAYLGKVDAWPILVEPQLDGGRYIISVRAGVRRGKLPASLRALLFWTDDWQRVSKWYSWSLPV